MKKTTITDPRNARAAIASLIAEGWQIDLPKLHREITGGLTDHDWLTMANGCLDYVMNALDAEKVIPISRFRK